MKHWLWVALLSVVLLISGCQDVVDRPSDVTYLTLWHGINPPSNRDVFDQLVKKFNQNSPKLQVDAIYIGQADQQLPKILTAVVGNAPPDLLWFDSILTGRLMDLQAIIPLEDWLNQSPLKPEVDPVLFEGMTLADHIWSIPFTTANVGIFYRPSLFQAAGITQLPRTWQEFQQVARQLTQDKNGDGRTDQYGIVLPLGKGEWTVFTWLPFMFSAGGEVMQGNRPNLNNEGALAALQLWSNLLKDNSAILSAPERGYEQDAFVAGRVAMQITGPWTLGFLSDAQVDFGVFPIPSNQQRATIVGGANLFVMKTNSQRQQATLKFLEYVLGEEFQTEWAIGTGSLPINLKARQNSTFQAYVAKQPVLKVFLDEMAWARSRPIIPSYSRVSESLGRAIEATLLGQDPQQALQASQTRLELIIGSKDNK